MSECPEWPGVRVSAWVHPADGATQVTDGATKTTKDSGRPEAFIQWKGTDVCLDFYCPCGMQSHLDAGFAYNVECSACGRVFAMPHTVELVEVPPSTTPTIGRAVEHSIEDPFTGEVTVNVVLDL